MILEQFSSQKKFKIIKDDDREIDKLKFDLELWQMAFNALTRPDLIYTTNNLRFFKDISDLAELFMEFFCEPYDEKTLSLIIRVNYRDNLSI